MYAMVRSLPCTTSLLVTGASSMGGWVGGERAAILESARARAAAPRMRGAAVEGGLLGVKPERTKYMPAPVDMPTQKATTRCCLA